MLRARAGAAWGGPGCLPAITHRGANARDNNVVTLSFEEQSKAYQALAQLKEAAAAGRLKLVSAVVVERDNAGQFHLRDGASDGSVGTEALTGTLLGSLVGLLLGPLGMLLGATTGALIGGSVSLDKASDRVGVTDQLMRAMPSGSTVLIAQVEEAAVEVVDKIAQGLGGVVLRRPVEAVRAEVEARVKAEAAAGKEARRVLHDEQREEWRDKFDDWKQELGERFDELQKKISDKFSSKKA